MRQPTETEMIEGIAKGFKSFLQNITDPNQMQPILMSSVIEKAMTAVAKEHLSKTEKKAGFVEIDGKHIAVFYTVNSNNDTIDCTDCTGKKFFTSYKSLVSQV